ncbi:hypothetical protein FBALC1_17037 [Flavobacteriales bacterium ALC-1]|nr:hypothetical protein FBALC1_17037 [Flavobacteriales bacterium ALC-1]
MDVDTSGNIHLATDGGYIMYNTATNMVEDYANLTSQSQPIGWCTSVKVNPMNSSVALGFPSGQGIAIYDGTDYIMYNSDNSIIGDFSSPQLHYTDSGLLYIFDKADTKYQTFESGVFSAVQTLTFRPQAIIENEAGTIAYFAGQTPSGFADGFYELDKSTDTFTHYTTSNSGIVHNGVNCFFRDTNDLLYIGGHRGVNTLDAMGNWATYQEPLPINPSLFYSVYSIDKFSDGTFLVNNSNPNSSEERGFSTVDFTTNTWTHYDSSVYCNASDQVQNMVLADDMVFTHFRKFGTPSEDNKLWSFDTSTNTCQEKDVNFLGIDDLGLYGITSVSISEDTNNSNELDINYIKNGDLVLKEITIPKDFTGNFPIATNITSSTSSLSNVYSVATANNQYKIVGDKDGLRIIDESGMATHIPHNIPGFEPYEVQKVSCSNQGNEIVNLIFKGFDATFNTIAYKTQCNIVTNNCSALEQVFVANRDLSQDVKINAIIEDGNIKAAGVKIDLNDEILIEEELWDEVLNDSPQDELEENINQLASLGLVDAFWIDGDGESKICFQIPGDPLVYCIEKDSVTNETYIENYEVDFDDSYDGGEIYLIQADVYREMNEEPEEDDGCLDFVEAFYVAFSPDQFKHVIAHRKKYGQPNSGRIQNSQNNINLEVLPGTVLENLPKNYSILNSSFYFYSETYFAAVISTNYGLLINTAIDYSSIALDVDEVSTAIDFKLYPNPANDIVSITDENIVSVEVYDLNGRNILSTKSNTFSIKHLSNGVYILKILGEDNYEVTKKLIKN